MSDPRTVGLVVLCLILSGLFVACGLFMGWAAACFIWLMGVGLAAGIHWAVGVAVTGEWNPYRDFW